VCVIVHSPRDSKELLEGTFCCSNVHPRVHRGEREAFTGTRLQEVKALWVRGSAVLWGGEDGWGSLLLNLRPCHGRPGLKASWIRERETEHKSKNWPVKENIHCCCWCEWKII